MLRLFRRKNWKSLSPKETKLMKPNKKERRGKRPQRRNKTRRRRTITTFTITTKSSKALNRFLSLHQLRLMRFKRLLRPSRLKDSTSNKPKNKKRKDLKRRDRRRSIKLELRLLRKSSSERRRVKKEPNRLVVIEEIVERETMKIEVEEDTEVTVETARMKSPPSNNPRKNLSDQRVVTPSSSRWTPMISLRFNET